MCLRCWFILAVPAVASALTACHCLPTGQDMDSPLPICVSLTDCPTPVDNRTHNPPPAFYSPIPNLQPTQKPIQQQPSTQKPNTAQYVNPTPSNHDSHWSFLLENWF